MRKTTVKKTIATAVLAAFAGTTYAATDLVDTAQVISATPIVEHITEPRQECAPAAAAAPAPQQERSVAGGIIGGVAGGIIGHQVGRGSGNSAATAVGAIVGAIVGDRVANPETVAAAPAQQCRTVQVSREVIKGYTVVYRYYDRDITTTLPYNPGPTVRVGVGVIDNAPVASAPTPAMLGSNVRAAGPAPVAEIPHTPAPAPAPVSATGGYQYRY